MQNTWEKQPCSWDTLFYGFVYSAFLLEGKRDMSGNWNIFNWSTWLIIQQFSQDQFKQNEYLILMSILLKKPSQFWYNCLILKWNKSCRKLRNKYSNYILRRFLGWWCARTGSDLDGSDTTKDQHWVLTPSRILLIRGS